MSKGQEALKELGECLLLEGALDIINQERIGFIAKELRALEIIKKKKVDIKYLYYRAEFNLEKYNDNYIETLTQEECDLLKEVLW